MIGGPGAPIAIARPAWDTRGVDERDDYADPDLGPPWRPPAASLIVLALAVAVAGGCGAFALGVWLLLRVGR
jgi:hypothetical protein